MATQPTDENSHVEKRHAGPDPAADTSDPEVVLLKRADGSPVGLVLKEYDEAMHAPGGLAEEGNDAVGLLLEALYKSVSEVSSTVDDPEERQAEIDEIFNEALEAADGLVNGGQDEDGVDYPGLLQKCFVAGVRAAILPEDVTGEVAVSKDAQAEIARLRKEVERLTKAADIASIEADLKKLGRSAEGAEQFYNIRKTVGEKAYQEVLKALGPVTVTKSSAQGSFDLTKEIGGSGTPPADEHVGITKLRAKMAELAKAHPTLTTAQRFAKALSSNDPDINDAYSSGALA